MKELFTAGRAEEKVYLYTLENENIRMSVTDYGAALVRFIEKKTGRDIVLGFDDAEGYIGQDGSCIGASIGRIANRIAKGTFTLNGKEYHIPINNNGNSNHGGLKGFDQKMFEAEEKEDRVIFHRIAPDGEEGFPGDLDVTIAYILLEDGIAVHTEGKALDQDTVFAYTNHSYFNLDESDDAMTHEVLIPADRCAETDEAGLMKGNLVPVEGTVFDFRTWTKLSDHVDDDCEQIRLAAGYDHFFEIRGEGMRHMASCRGRDLELTVCSDFPGVHMYTANFLDHIPGKKGKIYNRRSAVCFEAEYYPNAINYDGLEKPLIRAGETQKHTIEYHIARYGD